MGQAFKDSVYGDAEVMSPQELQALGLAPKPVGPLAQTTAPTKADQPALWGVPGARYLKPGEQASSFPSTLDNIKKNWPGILGTAATGLVGGGAITGPLMRAITMGGITAGGRAMQGDESPLKSGGVAAAGQLGGEAVVGGGLAAAQGLFRSAIGQQMATGLADYLRANVPALKNIKNLKQMLLDQGPVDAVHSAYDKSLKDLVNRFQYADDMVVPKDLAQSLGIPLKGKVDAPAFQGPGRAVEETVAVNPADAIANTVGKWRKDPKAFGRMTDLLEQGGFTDPVATKAYKSWAGIRDLMDKTGALEGNKFNPEKAQAGLSDFGTAGGLLRRGMQQDVSNILLPNGSLPIERGNHKLSGALLGAGLGATAGGPLGMLGHGGGAVGGAYLGSKIGQAIPSYTNVVPPGIQGPLAAGLGEAAVGQFNPPQEGHGE